MTAVLLRHTSPRPDTKLILLSIGIDNCLRQQTAITIIKDTRRLIRTARETFPQARIAIPLITVSIRLSATQLRCVKSFNDFVRENIEDVDSRAGYLNTLSTLKVRWPDVPDFRGQSPFSVICPRSKLSPEMSPILTVNGGKMRADSNTSYYGSNLTQHQRRRRMTYRRYQDVRPDAAASTTTI